MNTGIIGLVIIVLAAVGGLLAVAVKKLGKRKTASQTEESSDGQSNAETETESDPGKKQPTHKAE